MTTCPRLGATTGAAPLPPLFQVTLTLGQDQCQNLPPEIVDDQAEASLRDSSALAPPILLTDGTTINVLEWAHSDAARSAKLSTHGTLDTEGMTRPR